MPTNDFFIVAIELGSSKLRGIAGRKNNDGSISVLAVATEDSSSYIKRGTVYNIEKTVQGITNIVNKLKGILNREILQVYVGVGGQSILGVKKEITRNLPNDTIITQQMVNEMLDSNREKRYADKEILDVAIQEYKIGNDLQNDPAGIQANQFSGNFLNIICRKTFYDKLTDCFERAGIKIAEMGIAPLALADALLDDTSKRAGCMLVDLGAQTTTMLVYHKNILRHIAVIPLGSNNITKDLTTLKGIDDISVAEEMKCKYGCAYSEEIDKTLEYSIDLQNKVASTDFQQVIEARMLEIIENVWQQVPIEYRGKLNGGIFLTGGGSNIKNIVKAFRKNKETEKISVVSFVSENVNTQSKSINLTHDGTMNTLIGLLKKGEINCNGGERNTTLFTDAGNKNQQNTGATTSKGTGTPYEAGNTTGVRTPEDMAIASEQQRKKDKDKWEEAVAENTIAAYESYKEAFPNGFYKDEATKAIDDINAKNSKKKGGWFTKLRDMGRDIFTEPEE